jgi:hypothetical protein
MAATVAVKDHTMPIQFDHPDSDLYGYFDPHSGGYPCSCDRAAQSLTEQLAERFAARIRDRLLAPGSRLPSVRQCATQHQLSPVHGGGGL